MENLEIGDKVKMNGKCSVSNKDKNKVWIVCSNPVYVGDKVYIRLKGKTGGYAIDGLDLVEKRSNGQISLFDY